MVRIAVGGLMHESNTFAAARTDLAAFDAGGLETGPGSSRWGDAHHEVGRLPRGSDEFGFEAGADADGWATPSGPLNAGDLPGAVRSAPRGDREAGPVDAVLLALHGAMVAEGVADADGTLRSCPRPDRPRPAADRLRSTTMPTSPL